MTRPAESGPPLGQDHTNVPRDKLIQRIRDLESKAKKDERLQLVVHELQVHQEEIRTQNQQLIEAQAALEESRDRYANLYDFAPIAYVTLDDSGVIREINLTGSKLLGVERRWVIGTPFTLYVEQKDRDAFHQHLKRCRTEAGQVSSELCLKRRGGAPAPVELATSRAPSAKDLPLYRIVIIDHSEHRRIEEEKNRLILRERSAEARNEAKDRFLAILSHELRTPLTPILAVIGEMESASSITPQFRSDLHMIHRNIELEARLIDDLFDLTSISRGKLQLNRRTVDVHELIGYVLENHRENVAAKKLLLSVDLEAEDRFVEGDPARLQQVLSNLLRNAIKFTPEGGKIVIATRRLPVGEAGGPTNRLAIEVTDNGIGIEAEKLPLLFAAFEQGDKVITREYGGLGLGLAISKGLVEAHGGRILAMSEGRGKGATFRVELMIIPAPRPEEFHGGGIGRMNYPSESRSSFEHGPPGRKVSVLLVEDHPDSARILTRLLTARGYQVRTACSQNSALEAAREPFDLLISDLGLPDGSGLELMSKLQSRGMQFAGIALSGFGTEEDVRRSREAGFDMHLTKPVNFARIESTIENVLQEFRQGQVTKGNRENQ